MSGLSALKTLKCYGNPLTNTTFGLDQIYCKLPQRQSSDGAAIFVYETMSLYAPTPDYVTATNKNNATNKQWLVCSSLGGNITTTGSYVCGNPPPNMPLTELTTSGPTSAVNVSLTAAQNNTPV